MPSEAFGSATTTHLGSLLAWAAAAAQFNDAGAGQKLRALGVERVPPAPDGCVVRVVVGDARAPGPDPQGGPIETLLLNLGSQPGALMPLPALAGFAWQWHAPVTFHTSLAVQGAGLIPQRIPLPYFAGFVWTIMADALGVGRGGPSPVAPHS